MRKESIKSYKNACFTYNFICSCRIQLRFYPTIYIVQCFSTFLYHGTLEARVKLP